MGFWGDAWNKGTDAAKWVYGGYLGTAADMFGDDASVAANAQTRPLRQEQGAASAGFAGMGEQGFGALGQEAAAQRARLTAQAQGQQSISAEQLRQGLQQNIGGQMAMAASARPGQGAMAARTAAMGAGRAASGLAGQQAIAGLAERQQANAMLGQMLQGQRQLELQAALGGRQNAIGAYGMEGEGTSGTDKMLGAGVGVLGAIYSDERLKKDIKSGAKDADDFIASLSPKSFTYKDQRHGKGDRVGIMAQDLEKTKAGRMAVLDTPAGKQVDTAHLSGALAAATARLGERLDALEGKKLR